ncbi:hypothetical protein [Cohnella sp. JJ-181]|uniref:hypothetical protein n=1 Tax=Cohnella rhizoplanae TaxID=2974897 RepID=UPI0022FFA269|nr:hypothetical protein [Cohnella sp. JJ-181]CAI6048721.1 hypothetical protein COHCIP112018_01384 [Cohnella sp. JJ-181]
MNDSPRIVRQLRLGFLALGILLLPAACSSAHSPESADESPAAATSSPASGSPAPEVSAHAHNADAPKETGEAPSRDRPELGGISLGMDLTDAEAAIGASPGDSYALPDAGRTISMREYGGLTVGYDASDRVVYVEISSANIRSGIPDVDVGSSSADAARRLALKEDPSAPSLTADVQGGILRLDLDPATGKVVALKLIGQALV